MSKHVGNELMDSPWRVTKPATNGFAANYSLGNRGHVAKTNKWKTKVLGYERIYILRVASSARAVEDEIWVATMRRRFIGTNEGPGGLPLLNGSNI